MHFRQAILISDGRTYPLVPGASNSFETFFADVQCHAIGGDMGLDEGLQYSVFLHLKQDMVLQRLEIQFDMPLDAAARFFANGYQSWSESRWFPVHRRIPRLRRWAFSRMGLYGDEGIAGIPRGKGYLHSWTYTLLRGLADTKVTFLGSLNERTGFTIFMYDQANGILTVRKDLEGLQLSHSFPALDFVVLKASENAAYDAYFQLLEVKPPTAPPAVGWTSWYAHFNRISESVLVKNLDAFAALQDSIEQETSEKTPAYFQVDDGWQMAVGDWLSVKPEFPGQMGRVAGLIREKGLLPGLWLAPFVAAKNSELVRKHPDWLLNDAKNKPLKVGWNPLWGGWYYALNFYHPGVQSYLAGVFHMVCEKWGFELLKLDFLFAVCLAPPPGKTRGQVMYEAMEFMRQLAGSKHILGCGVPLGSCFGLVEYCRIGGDIHLSWEHRLLSFLRHRERVSTVASLRSTLNRWALNGRAFHNDPDVFILRTAGQHLTPVQQQTVLTVNALLGNLLFTSDDTSEYNAEQVSEYMEALALRGSHITAVSEWENDVYRIDFQQERLQYAAFCNLNGKAQLLRLAMHQTFLLHAFETIIISAASA